MPWRMLKRAARARFHADYPLPLRFLVNLVVAIPLVMLQEGVANLLRHASSRPALGWWNPWWDFGILLVFWTGMITLMQSMPDYRRDVAAKLGRNGEISDSDSEAKPTRETSKQFEAVAAQGKKKAG